MSNSVIHHPSPRNQNVPLVEESYRSRVEAVCGATRIPRSETEAHQAGIQEKRSGSVTLRRA